MDVKTQVRNRISDTLDRHKAELRELMIEADKELQMETEAVKRSLRADAGSEIDKAVDEIEQRIASQTSKGTLRARFVSLLPRDINEAIPVDSRFANERQVTVFVESARYEGARPRAIAVIDVSDAAFENTRLRS